jgi:hypothetical protein
LRKGEKNCTKAKISRYKTYLHYFSAKANMNSRIVSARKINQLLGTLLKKHLTESCWHDTKFLKPEIVFK